MYGDVVVQCYTTTFKSILFKNVQALTLEGEYMRVTIDVSWLEVRVNL